MSRLFSASSSLPSLFFGVAVAVAGCSDDPGAGGASAKLSDEYRRLGDTLGTTVAQMCIRDRIHGCPPRMDSIPRREIVTVAIDVEEPEEGCAGRAPGDGSSLRDCVGTDPRRGSRLVESGFGMTPLSRLIPVLSDPPDVRGRPRRVFTSALLSTFDVATPRRACGSRWRSVGQNNDRFVVRALTVTRFTRSNVSTFNGQHGCQGWETNVHDACKRTLPRLPDRHRYVDVIAESHGPIAEPIGQGYT